jgi:hypothetical protein
MPGGGGQNWEKEFAKAALALEKSKGPMARKILEIEPKQLVAEFALTAPPQVQFAVKTTVASLLGSLSAQVEKTDIQSTGMSLASLMFNMQMTGYMFSNAEFRRSMLQPLVAVRKPLPKVSGELDIKVSGVDAKVSAEAYMSEIRKEVEDLRAELVERSPANDQDSESALVRYLQQMPPGDRQALTQDTPKDVMEAMLQLVQTLLNELEIQPQQEISAPIEKMRDLLITQMVMGYKLHDFEQRGKLKDIWQGSDDKKE